MPTFFSREPARVLVNGEEVGYVTGATQNFGSVDVTSFGDTAVRQIPLDQVDVELSMTMSSRAARAVAEAKEFAVETERGQNRSEFLLKKLKQREKEIDSLKRDVASVYRVPPELLGEEPTVANGGLVVRGVEDEPLWSPDAQRGRFIGTAEVELERWLSEARRCPPTLEKVILRVDVPEDRIFRLWRTDGSLVGYANPKTWPKEAQQAVDLIGRPVRPELPLGSFRKASQDMAIVFNDTLLSAQEARQTIGLGFDPAQEDVYTYGQISQPDKPWWRRAASQIARPVRWTYRQVAEGLEWFASSVLGVKL